MRKPESADLPEPVVVTYERADLNLETAFAGLVSPPSDRGLKTRIRSVSPQRLLSKLLAAR
jgi:hypothetical protein